jgi:hypothetical protein
VKDKQTINNRDYLAFVLSGGAGKAPYYQIESTVNEAGQVLFSRALERYGEAGGGYDIQITGPGGKFEIWMDGGSEKVVIQFEDTRAAPAPPIPITPARVLDAFKRWKYSPGVQEIITNYAGTIVKEYAPAEL